MTDKPQPKGDTPEELRNEDAITGQPGSHPVGSGVGAAVGGAAAGAAAGAIGGPIGTVAGSVIGGIAGGLAGKSVAEYYDPTVENEYWRSEYANRPYHSDDVDYDKIQPAYQSGWESFDADSNEEWASREADARSRWEAQGGDKHLTWEQARPAAMDAYTRIESGAAKPA